MSGRVRPPWPGEPALACQTCPLRDVATEPLPSAGRAPERLGHPPGESWLNNPQNAVLGTAVYFGLPYLCLSLLTLALLLRRLASRGPAVPLSWARGMMVFSAVYFAFEPNPFAFCNAHHLFFWLPVAGILSAEPGLADQRSTAPGGVRPGAAFPGRTRYLPDHGAG